MEQYFICDLMFSFLAVALAEFHTALHEPVGLKKEHGTVASTAEQRGCSKSQSLLPS